MSNSSNEDMYHVKESCRDAVSLLGSMNRGVKWDFWPVMLLCFTHIFAGLPFEHTNNSHYVSTVKAFLSLECIALGMKLHCPHSRWSMTRNSIKGLAMQRPSIIYIRTGFYCVGMSRTLRDQACEDDLNPTMTFRQRNKLTECPHPLIMSNWQCVFVCLCYRGPDTSWLSKHRHGSPAKGCGENTHCYDVVCSEW